MVKRFYLNFIGLSMVFFLLINNPQAADIKEVGVLTKRPQSPITETYEALKRQKQEDRRHLFRRMCEAPMTHLSNRWSEKYKDLFGGGVSDLFLQNQLRLISAFGEEQKQFTANSKGEYTPSVHLEFLRGLANRLKGRVEAGEFDPPTEGRQAAG